MESCLDQINCIDTLKRMMDESEDFEYRREVRSKIRKIKKEEEEKAIQPLQTQSYPRAETNVRNNTKNNGISDENKNKTKNLPSKNKSSLENYSANNNYSTTNNHNLTNNNHNYLTNNSSTNNNSPTSRRLKTKVKDIFNINETDNQTETKIKLKKVLDTKSENIDNEKNDKLSTKSELNNKRMTNRQIKDKIKNKIDIKPADGKVEIGFNNNKDHQTTLIDAPKNSDNICGDDFKNNNINNKNNKKNENINNNKNNNKINNNSNHNKRKMSNNDNKNRNINKENNDNNNNSDNNNNKNNNNNDVAIDFSKVKNNLNKAAVGRKDEQNKTQTLHTNTCSILTNKRVQVMTPRIARKMFNTMNGEENGTNRTSFTSKCFNANTTKEKMLAWCKNRLKGYENIEIKNFSSSWSNGLAFCALANSFFPSEFDYDALSADNKEDNFRLAFDTLSNKGEVPALLDVEDMMMTSRPDWKCVFTYVNSIITTMQELKKEEGMD